MTSSRFDPSSTSKTLNLSFLRFNEQFESENLDFRPCEIKLFKKKKISEKQPLKNKLNF